MFFAIYEVDKHLQNYLFILFYELIFIAVFYFAFIKPKPYL